MTSTTRTTSVGSAGSSSSPRSTRTSVTSARGSPSGGLRSSSLANVGHSLPPAPAIATQRSQNSQYSQAIATTMTIDEMRMLHDRALRGAEAKRTELRLVLASRYRELVGSSDEVIIMNERSQELYDLVHGLPPLFDKLVNIANASATGIVEEEKDELEDDEVRISQVMRDLSALPRMIHRALDTNDALKATTTLIDLFSLIASCSDAYPLAIRACGTRRKTSRYNVTCQRRNCSLSSFGVIELSTSSSLTENKDSVDRNETLKPSLERGKYTECQGKRPSMMCC